MKVISELGKIEGRFTVSPVLLAEGQIAICGSSYHISIRKKDAERIGKGKTVGVMLFEFNGEGEK